MRFLPLTIIHFLAAPALLTAHATYANDASVSGTPSGGLKFEKTDLVKMESEYLEISHKKITVKYRFKNISDKNVDMTIGFPLPDVRVAMYCSEHRHAVPHDQDFVVRVNGKDVLYDTAIRVYKYKNKSGDVDITREFLETTQDPFDNKIGNEENKQKLDTLGVVIHGDDMGCDGTGNWVVQKTYYWKQSFPPGETVKIEHAYSPWNYWYNEVTAGLWQAACMDATFKRAVVNMLNKADPGNNYTWESVYNFGAGSNVLEEGGVEYILKTGANWAGSIGDFTIKINKDEALVSFCQIPGITTHRVGDSFIGSAHNYIPTKDLFIYYVGKSIDY